MSHSSRALTLTVSRSGRVYPSRALAAHLRLRHGQPIDLVPPRGPWNSIEPWHLDVRNTALGTFIARVKDSIMPQFNCRQVLSPARFRDPAATGKRGAPSAEYGTLLLVLAGQESHPGYIPLLPVYAQPAESMPNLPTAKRRPYQPASAPKEYQAHAVRTLLYDTSAWRKLRKDHLRREPLCRACVAAGRTMPATVLDHITPVNEGGDFWDSQNHQPLCASCHAAKSARERHHPKPDTTHA